MALGLNKDEIKSKVLAGLTKPRTYLNPLPTEEFERIAGIIADVMTENNNKILSQLAMADVNINDF